MDQLSLAPPPPCPPIVGGTASAPNASRPSDLVAGWVGVGVAGVGALAVFTQRVLQVGPQRCVLRSAFGVPCPICGLSRCGLALLHLDPLHALRTDPLGVVVLVTIAVIATWTLGVAVLRRGALPRASRWGIPLLAVLVLRWAVAIVSAA